MVLFLSGLGQLYSGLVVGVKLSSEFVLDVIQLDLKSLDQSGNWVAAGIFGFVPLEVEQIFADGRLLLDTLQVPFVILLVL